MREGVAREYGIALYRQYGEAEAAHFLQVDHTTLKRMRRDGKVPYVAFSERKIRYLGIHIVDMLIAGDKWASLRAESSSVENGISDSGKIAPPSTVVDTTSQPAQPSASRSA